MGQWTGGGGAVIFLGIIDGSVCSYGAIDGKAQREHGALGMAQDLLDREMLAVIGDRTYDFYPTTDNERSEERRP